MVFFQGTAAPYADDLAPAAGLRRQPILKIYLRGRLQEEGLAHEKIAQEMGSPGGPSRSGPI